MLGSRRPSGCPQEAFRIDVPRLEGYFTGSGDLFAALLLAWLQRHPTLLSAALEGAVATLQAVLKDTATASAHTVGESRTAAVWAARELRLVANAHVLAGEVAVEHRAVPVALGQ